MTSALAIPFSNWQVALGEPGVVLGGLEEIDQAIRICLSTPLGADPHRPDFGTALQNYLDWPQPLIKPYIVREVYKSLRKWEPRIEVVRVSVTHEESQTFVTVSWRPKDAATSAVQTTRVRLPS